MKYAIGIGVAPTVLAFLAGFFGFGFSLSWPVCIAWFVASVAAGGAVSLARRRS